MTSDGPQSMREAIASAVDWYARDGRLLGAALVKDLQQLGIPFKTLDYFDDQLDRLVQSLYEGSIDELEFVQLTEDLLYGQLHQAWMEGMEQNGLNVMTTEFETELGGILAEENGNILGFADAIAASAQANATTQNHQAALDALYSRAGLWKNRYTDVVNRSALYTAAAADKLEWQEGDTLKKCDQCVALDGIVAPAKVWLELGVHPQDPPNEKLGCQGWKCGCGLVPTDKRATPNAADRIRAAIGG